MANRRRSFLRQGAGALLTSAALRGAPAEAAVRRRETRPLRGTDRLARAYELRERAARAQRAQGMPRQAMNNDASHGQPFPYFAKGLPHDRRGRVDPAAYAAYRAALESGRHEDFEAIPLGGPEGLGIPFRKGRKFVSPQSAWAFVLEGPDPHQVPLAAPPAFDSAETAGEMVELYWAALARDVSFRDYGSDPTIAAACADLSARQDFRGPREKGAVTPGTLFRGDGTGNLAGPHVSQFLYKRVPFGACPFEQRIKTPVGGRDYLHTYSRWLDIVGGDMNGTVSWDPRLRYIRNGRDLAAYVQLDFSYQAFLAAGLYLLDIQALPDEGNPYIDSRTQSGFVTFGEPHLLEAVARVSTAALKATWVQKWLVHNRLRPEEYGGLVHAQRAGLGDYPLHADLFQAEALDRVKQEHGSWLLPQSYPDGCPLHPAYPGGHAAIAGACTTVLKAFFEETAYIPDPVVPSADGLSLEPYRERSLTVGGELDKLASNVAMGRSLAGIHWRSDNREGLRLGEHVAVEILREEKGCLRESCRLSFVGFDGQRVEI